VRNRQCESSVGNLVASGCGCVWNCGNTCRVRRRVRVAHSSLTSDAPLVCTTPLYSVATPFHTVASTRLPRYSTCLPPEHLLPHTSTLFHTFSPSTKLLHTVTPHFSTPCSTFYTPHCLETVLRHPPRYHQSHPRRKTISTRWEVCGSVEACGRTVWKLCGSGKCVEACGEVWKLLCGICVESCGSCVEVETVWKSVEMCGICVEKNCGTTKSQVTCLRSTSDFHTVSAQCSTSIVHIHIPREFPLFHLCPHISHV